MFRLRRACNERMADDQQARVLDVAARGGQGTGGKAMIDLPNVMRLHSLWVAGDTSGVRANLRWANLREADLHGANLHGADLRGADLREADLCGANLRGANLCGANLRWANLHGADLREADLRGADLRGADLRGANLREADLHGANLRGANLRDADLNETILTHCVPSECGRTGLALLGLMWPVYYHPTDGTIAIGCQVHSAEKWAAFTDAEIAGMHDDAAEFWAKNRTMILAIKESMQ